ncbi:unnamed protein product [marine sediment metagenome]|uniref:Uncharacterized protein n=1 Tax=marine sediment metagenome TaxID=412755 RepID=X1PMZ6_9ZZZZ
MALPIPVDNPARLVSNIANGRLTSITLPRDEVATNPPVAEVKIVIRG